MNNTASLWAGAVAVLCVAAMLTLLTWPPTDPTSWQPLSPPAWCQFGWLEGLGFLLSAIPSLVIYKFDSFFAANEYLRYPAAAFLIIAEVIALAFGTYALVAKLQKLRKPAMPTL